MAIYSKADVDALYLGAGSGPDTAYWAASLWLYVVSDRNDFGAAIGFVNDAQSDYAGFWVGSDGSTFYVTSDASYNSPGSITIGSWHHIYVANRNGSGSGGFRLASSTTYSTETCTGMTVGSALPFIINNADGGFNSAEFFDGYFAHVKVWSGNGNLPTDAQLQAEGGSIRPLMRNVWAWWPLWDVGNMTTDFSGNGHTLSVSGSHTIRTVDGPGTTRFNLNNSRAAVRFSSLLPPEWTWTMPWPVDAGASVRAKTYFIADTAVGNVAFDARVEAVSSGDALNLNTSEAFYARAGSGGQTVPATAGHLGRADIILTTGLGTPSFVDENHQAWGYVSGDADIVNLPSNTLAGDLIVVFVVADASQASLVLPGFTRQITNISFGTGPHYCTIFSKRADGNESATLTITGWSGDPGTSNLAAAWRGVPTTYDTYVKTNAPSDGSYVLTFGSLSAAHPGALDIQWAWINSSGAFSSWSNATERYDDNYEAFGDRFGVSAGSQASATVTKADQLWGTGGTFRLIFSQPASDGIAEGDEVRLSLTRDTSIAGNTSANVDVLGVVLEKL